MKVEVYGGEGYSANCYLLSDDAEREFALVDPSVSPAAIIERRGSLPPVRRIVLTHAHFDHMLYVNEWRELTRAPLAVHEAEASALSDGERNVYRLFTGKDGGMIDETPLVNDTTYTPDPIDEILTDDAPAETSPTVTDEASDDIDDILFESDPKRVDDDFLPELA